MYIATHVSTIVQAKMVVASNNVCGTIIVIIIMYLSEWGLLIKLSAFTDTAHNHIALAWNQR